MNWLLFAYLFGCYAWYLFSGFIYINKTEKKYVEQREHPLFVWAMIIVFILAPITVPIDCFYYVERVFRR